MLVSGTPADPRALTDGAPVALWHADHTGTLIYANAAWFALTGSDALTEAGWFEGVHPDDVGRARAAWATSLERGKSFDLEYRRHGFGGYRRIRDRATPQVDDTHRLAGFAGVSEDITEQRATESALRLADMRFKSLVDAVPASVYVVAGDGSIEFCNQHWLEYGGVTLEETQRLGATAFVHPDDFDAMAASFASGGSPGDGQREAEMRVRRYDGVYRWHMARSVPFEVDGKRYFVGTTVDVDDRRYQEDAERFLGTAGEELSSTLDPDEVLNHLARLAIPFLGEGVAIDVLDGEGSIRTAAVAHENPTIEVMAREMRERFPPEMDGPHPVARCLKTGREILVQTDERFLHDIAPEPDHLRMAEALRSTTGLTVPISARGTVIGTLTVFRGGQARYEAREVASAVQLARRAGMALENARLFEQVQESASALERAGTAKDEFLGLVSHELRTPLTTLKGTASVLRRHGESISEADRLQALQDIERGADQLQHIVENMLTLAQPELAGDDELEPMLLRRVVSSVVQEQMAQFPDRQIHLSAPTELLPVMGHPAYLRQIFQNLVGNARKYSPAGSDIDVRIERSGSEVIVSVEDRGMGIGREEATRLFQPFFRTDEAARARAGLGLGLTVCSRLVEHQGGRIWAEPREGGGTAFRFAMPVLEADTE